MPRSVVDATRFTATAPHMYSKPSNFRSPASNTFSPSSNPGSRSLPRGPSSSPSQRIPPYNSPAKPETPAEKVARLRAAHVAQRNAQISQWDKIVVRGRIVADAAHRYTALGLIGLTVICGGITIFALGDMIIYNRRKRKLYFEEQHRLLQQRLVEARAAFAKGIADEDQMLVLNRERAAEEAEAARKAKKGIWKSIKRMFSTEGLKQEQTDPLDVLGEEGLRKMGGDSPVVGEVVQAANEGPGSSGIIQAVEEKRRSREREPQSHGLEEGSLDRVGGEAAEATKARRSWTSWVTFK